MSQAGVSISTPIHFKDHLPKSTNLVVIGAGIVGIFAALYARRLGLSVLVTEKGRVAGEQSSRNWGWCRQQGRDPDELPIVMEANRLWGEIDAEVKGRAGFARTGCLYLARNEARLSKLAEWLDVARAHQLDTRLLSSAELAARIDLSACVDRGKNPWVGGLWTPTDARAEPWAAVPAIAELAHDEGVLIREECAVRGLDVAAGRVTGVITERGTVRAEQVVLAGGAWSSLLLKHHGVFIPQLSFRATVGRTAELPDFYAGAALDEGLAFRRRKDGGYTLADRQPVDFFLGRHAIRSARYYLPTLRSSLENPRILPFGPREFPDSWGTSRRWDEASITPFERTRVLDPKPNPQATIRMEREFEALFPRVGRPKITNAWAGMVDTMPDIVPIIDRVPALDGLILATGMSGHGFGIGPGVGRIVADMAGNRPMTYDLTRFRFDRFTDGSRLSVGPAV